MNTLKNKNVLVTGGAGFIGSHIVDALPVCGASHSINDLFAALKKISGYPAVEAEYLPPRPDDVRKTPADITKITPLLTCAPRIDFLAGLERTSAWLKEQ